MARVIEVVPHDPGWAAAFQAEKLRIEEALGDNVLAVHHAGSTAIPGIKAKPVLDFLVVVSSISEIDSRAAPMQALGYRFKGENGIAGRRYFQKLEGEKHTHHVHAFQYDHPEVEAMLLFRDYLIAHPEDAQEYSRLKEHLAEQFRYDAEGYTLSKDSFIRNVLRKARQEAGPA